ncbi:AAA family ATPase, partial [Methanocalculus sp.]|uniref:AAA family ATPase n=1 Tax=Methanocalculus sp. TaxID=2004547 RepID=UPI0025EF2E5D
SKELLTKIFPPPFPSDFVKILSKQLNDVIDDAEARINRQISAHCMGEKGEKWLSQGVDYIYDDECPFCGQRVDANELIAAYRSHFNDAYQELKKEVAELPQQILDSIGETPLNKLQHIHSNNLILFEFWKQFDQISAPDLDFEDLVTKYQNLRKIALDLAQKKSLSPSEPILPGDDFELSLQALDSLQTFVEAYNNSVDDTNTTITRIKDDTQQVSDIYVLKSELAELEANKKRFDHEVIQAVKEYQEALNAKISLEQKKETFKEELDEHCQNTLPSCESSINKYLDQFNAGFRITNSRHMYTGGSPSSHYQIEINSNTVDLGDSRKQLGIPHFKTALSSGDRSALALAFFLATLEHDPDINKTIIILDDPFTSQDRFRRTCTQQLICQFANSAHQVIVLSHDPHFLKLIWDEYPRISTKTLQLLYQSTENTTIGNCDIEAETQSTYQKNHSILLYYYRERKGDPLNVALKIRPFLEGMLRSRFPGHFIPNEWLGDYIKKIREAQSTDGLSQAHNILSEIEAINGYSKKYHHDQNPNADSEVLSEDELHGFVKRTLRLVGGC